MDVEEAPDSPAPEQPMELVEPSETNMSPSVQIAAPPPPPPIYFLHRRRSSFSHADSTAYQRDGSIRRMEVEHPNIKRWIMFYPIYINPKKTIAQGRRISAEKGCENPTCIEISDCCNDLKLSFSIELDKAHPRDFMQRGRVRVLLKKEDGSFYNPAISSRKQLMLHVAELVPKHGRRLRSRMLLLLLWGL